MGWLKGTKHSIESRAKMSRAAIRAWQCPEYRETIGRLKRRNPSFGMLGKKHSPETREKIRQGNLGKKRSSETRARMSQANTGRKLSVESRAKMGQTISRNWKNIEFRNRVIKAITGRTFSLEHREKLHLAGLGRKHPPTSLETRERNRQARLRQHFPTKMTSIELLLRDEFHNRQLQFEMHKTMFGRFQPDFAFPDFHLIVQADGEYWHSRLDRIKNDCDFNIVAHNEGWEVIRFSGSEIKNSLMHCVDEVERRMRR